MKAENPTPEGYVLMNRTIELVKTVYEIGQLTEFESSQIAMAGRSNVGKSSLINCLGGRKKLAKISSTPGKTRSINFYQVHPDEFMLVDLPGYGYARCSKTERAKWAELIEKYIQGTKQLKAVAVLLDSRLSPQKIDIELTSYLRKMGVPIIAVLTKADKCKQKDLAKIQSQWKALLQSEDRPLFFSSKTGLGRDALWDKVAEQAGT